MCRLFYIVEDMVDMGMLICGWKCVFIDLVRKWNW